METGFFVIFCRGIFTCYVNKEGTMMDYMRKIDFHKINGAD